MAQATLVEMNIQDGQHLIDRLIQDGVTVTGAAWVKESESGDWYLYLVTPLVGADGGKKSAYHRVNEVIRQMQQEGILTEPPEKKVIGPHDPIAKDILAHRASRSARIPTRFQGARLGELAVDEAFLYPPAMQPKNQLCREDKNRCVFVAQYKKVGHNQWIRTGTPDIELDEDVQQDNLPDAYNAPQVEVIKADRPRAKVRVFDEKAIDLRKPDLLGDYSEAARRCDDALLKQFPGDVILRNLSSW